MPMTALQNHKNVLPSANLLAGGLERRNMNGNAYKAKVDKCIGWVCPHCGRYNYESDTLENNGEEIDERAVESDVIACRECWKDCFVYRSF